MPLVELTVESLAHGGEGIARHEGRVVFVRGAVPGDRLLAEVGHEGRFERARIAQLLTRGASRVDPPCPIVDSCGGCPVQQLSYAAQREAKRALLADALSRIGGAAQDSYELAPVVASPRELRYRRRARLHRASDGRFGFSGERGVVPVDECLLFEPGLQQLADALRAAGPLPGVLDLGLDTSESGKGAIDLRTEGAVTPGLRQRAKELVRSLKLRGATLSSATTPGNAVPGASELIGDPVLVDAAGPHGELLRSRPDLFAQANRGAVPLLQGEALLAVGSAGRVLELFCGSGTLTLPLLGSGAHVTGVEFAGPSLALLRKSADEVPGFSQRVRLFAGDAAKVVPGLDAAFDAVLLDPPRTGAAAAVRAVARLRIPRLAYVSCDAPTLARDAKLLAQAGYALVRAVPIDLFPQTAHFETVATFALR